ncbi:hypothetical protein BDF22DRAFT_653056 [Syncephalis plumigaleata]|nr:hypothetical protein BDF22DRAFT_653056 [Syncephalis plumigaleata]
MNWKTVYHQPNYPGLEPYTHSSTIPLLTSINTTMKLSTFKIAAFVAATTICISNAVEALSAQKQHCLINEIRAKEGKQPFIHDASLAKAAAERAFLMADADMLTARFPGEPTPKERLLKIDANSKIERTSQVPGYGARSDDEIVQRIMNTSFGRQIILGPSTHLGIGLAEAADGDIYWEHFYAVDANPKKTDDKCPAFAELPILKASKKQ